MAADLFMENELFSRNWAFITPEHQEVIKSTRLFIAGSGLGSVIAQFAVRTGFGKFILADGDNVELSNLNRQAFFRTDIGQNKAQALSRMLLDINDNIKVDVIDAFLVPETLDAPIARSDIIVNTIDFDHPAFLECNKKAREHGKTVLFPLNIGWGGALLVFDPTSPTLEEILELPSGQDHSYDQIKRKLVMKIVSSNLPAYLSPLVDSFMNPVPGEWRNDPQLAIGCAVSASLVVTASIAIISNNPVRIVPDFIYLDVFDLLQRKTPHQGRH